MRAKKKVKVEYNKDYFIAQYITQRGNNCAKLDEILDNLSAYMSNNEYDMQLDLASHAWHVHKEACNEVNAVGEIYYEMADPVFKLLKSMDWGIFELHVVANIIGYTRDYITGIELMNEAIDVLDGDFSKDENYNQIKTNLCYNLSSRLLHAKYYDKVDLQRIQMAFDQCINMAMERKDDDTFKTMLLIRKALFHGDCKAISRHIDDLEATNNRWWIEYTKDSVIDFLPHLGNDITTPLLNMLIGHQIKKRRKELGISTSDFGDALDTTQTVVNEFERGDKGIGGPRLYRIAKVLQVDMGYFFGETKKNPPNLITDITTHKITQLVSNLSEDDKGYVLNFIRGFVRHSRKKLSQLGKVNVQIREDE